MSRKANLAAGEAADAARLLHELEVHAAELEQQNVELRLSREEAARERTRYQELYDAAPLAYFTLDLDGRITDLNSAAAVLLGVSKATTTKVAFLDFVASDSATNFRDFLADVAVANGLGMCELKLHSKRLGDRFVRLVGRLEAGASGFLVAATDITERWQYEQELAAAKAAAEAAKLDAEAANRAKSAFLANMSHEIRTPLHVITGMACLVRRSSVTPGQTERLDRIGEASAHLLAILNDILDLSKIEAGKCSLETAPLSIGAIMDSVCSMIATAAAAKQLAMRIENHLLSDRFWGDATRLRQALLNYANNAVKFTEKGSVTLSASLTEESDDDAIIRFEVTDTGIGISADVMPKLFSPFQQADSSTTRRYGGTGLGLVITQKIAELMGGNAGAASALGTGSTFWFTVRMRKAKSEEKIAEQSPVESSVESPEAILTRDYGQLRLLIVDDDPDNLYITQHLLREVWPKIDMANDGIEAVELAAKNRYDLILMDIRMPRMDGLEATRRIRQLPSGRNVVILALTANAFPEDRTRCIDAGMNDLIPKGTAVDAPFAAILQFLPKISH